MKGVYSREMEKYAPVVHVLVGSYGSFSAKRKGGGGRKITREGGVGQTATKERERRGGGTETASNSHM